MEPELRLEDMTAAHLLAFAKTKGLKFYGNTKKQIIIDKLRELDENMEAPVDVYQDMEGKIIVELRNPPEPEKSVVYASGRVLVTHVGMFDKGYHVVKTNDLKKILMSKKMRLVEHDELVRLGKLI